jgi:hypothetical protein
MELARKKTANMNKKVLVTCALCGLGMALVFTVPRIFLLHYAPSFFDSEGGDWFNMITLIFWPGVFNLTVLQDKEPVKVVFVVWTIAVLLNGVIYGVVGWLLWQVGRFFGRLGQGKSRE